ncbi:site-specific tyrosine recombinase XerD [Rubripirellula obstinata]|uniref:Site-specific tyrosine recombinase XerD n=1 Tax=Rubripirellula obstinata TaxID=406547 RepID=A0A5B1CCH2_9BACT|nr:site-specific tyrosine recombinase XerD [Rubripirellula obstinata]
MAVIIRLPRRVSVRQDADERSGGPRCHEADHPQRSTSAKKVSLPHVAAFLCHHLLEAGVSLKFIQQALGHSSLQTTMIYLHLSETGEANARQVIEKIFVR